MSAKKPFSRLPTTVLPSNYDLVLTPDLASDSFTGRETITVSVVSPTPTVTLNCADIEVQSASFTSAGGEGVAATVELCAETQTLKMKFPGDLPVGDGEIHIEFSGILNDKLCGFYRSSYTDGEGVVRKMAVTQFEPVDARRAFPCWDEPAVKATFDVTLVTPKNLVALSNMPVKEEVEDGDLKVTKYDRTPIMSTYLLAFVVGEFDFVEGKDANDTLIRVYTALGKKHQGKFALDVSIKTIPFYTEYFGIDYPLPKMDLIAIPDFAAGAMENWGLVTYRETALLVDPDNTSTEIKQRVALVVGHEIAHQWFGNLVTMEWWTHLWLNEGFANWIEYLCVDYCFPKWDIWLQYINSELSRALELDALDNSHPIEVPVGHPEEIDEIFDTISYAKGSSVIRMLHEYLGTEAYRKGLAAYLKAHKYKNTQTEDLWAALEEASSKPVAKVMSTWTSKMGYPVLTVDVVEEGNKVTLTVEQQKFCADGSSNNYPDYLWCVPILVVTKSNPNTPQSFLLESKTGSFVLEGAKPGDWVKVNANQIGVFRVRYSNNLLPRLFPAIKNHDLGNADRLGIQEDLFALAKAGYSSTAEVLTLMGSYVNERNYVVLSSISRNLAELRSLFSHLPCIKGLKIMTCKIFKRILDEVGWVARDNDSHTDSLMRNMLISVLGVCEEQEVISKCRELLKGHPTPKPIPADIRRGVYTVLSHTGDEAVYDRLMELWNEADLHEEKDRIQRMLGKNSNPQLRARTLNFAMSDKMRSCDAPFVLAGVAVSGHEGRHENWDFVKNNWDTIVDKFAGNFLMARLVQFSCGDFTDKMMHDDVETFFRENKAPKAERAVKQALEGIKLRTSWLERDAEEVAKWLGGQPFEC